MMADLEHQIVRLSVDDVIHMLENSPVHIDMIPAFTAMKFMNRAPIAHLSIERALKSLISVSGGHPNKTHALKALYQELRRVDQASAEYLEQAFQAAVQHYRYNPNAEGTKHLRTLESYLGSAGSNATFEAMRYWELTPSAEGAPLRHVFLPLHIELLHALGELVLEPNRPKDNVASRVERAVCRAMADTRDLAFGTGSPNEHSVKSYIAWLNGFPSWSTALTAAVQSGFQIGDEFMNNIAYKAYHQLLGSSDHAVSYFASFQDVLPKQPRDIVPCVEWQDPEKRRHGIVRTPAGTVLGHIGRGLDNLWYITPIREGPISVSAKASSQTDARCYLANLLSRVVKVDVSGNVLSLRLVGERDYIADRNYPELMKRWGGNGDDNIWTHKVTLWDSGHGIAINDSIRIEIPFDEENDLDRIIEGRVTEVAENVVYISGAELYGPTEDDPD